jgi:DNA-binding transcriptional MerR regulator/methylmalonyl-CoA mutase cobalamin-binding subunit
MNFLFVADNLAMNAPDAAPFEGFSIAEVARETGLGKDTLRVWERRYGFPVPARTLHGDRLYSSADVERLRLIRHLMLLGHRPGQLVAAPLEALRQKLPALVPTPLTGTEAHLPAAVQEALALLHRHEVDALRALLAQSQARLGLGPWVLQLVAPLVEQVGLSWARGHLGVDQEHLCTELLQAALRQAVQTLAATGSPRSPRVLLTTLPGETHGLGLLMAEALLTLEQASGLSLGVQTPLDALVNAAQAHRADVVALSATACLPVRELTQMLTTLRQALPAHVALWLGGSATRLQRAWPAGCLCLGDLADIAPAVAAWRAEHEPG